MELQPCFTEAEIEESVARVAADLARDYEGENLVLVGILNGSFVFLADLVRMLDIPLEVDFIRARSYGKRMQSSGAVEITKDIETDITGRHVVMVEDILDTGLTVQFVGDRLRAGSPASVRTCALLVREGREPPDYMGMWVPAGFVVGYGIDYAEQFRWLRDIRMVPGTGDTAS